MKAFFKHTPPRADPDPDPDHDHNESRVVSELPSCDIHAHFKDDPSVLACYDGKTVDGPWANMCESCFNSYGIGLGLGRGQRLVLKTGGRLNDR